ncbi:MAG: DegV family protein [Syntrophomonadaceae bacterium]
MEKIALVADSACDLPQDLVEQYDIKILPLKVIYPDGEYSDREDIQPEEVYRRMPGEVPKTSQPSLQEIKTVFERCRQDGFTHVLAIALSSRLSGTFQAMELAARDFEDITIKVFDTRTLSMATGWMVLDAARNIMAGLGFAKVMERLTALQPKVRAYYVIETLDYLRRGGRIGLVAGMLGEFLNLKPIIGVNEEGIYYTHAKVRGRAKSIEKLMDLVTETVGNRPFNLAVMHGGARDIGERIAAKFGQMPNLKELIFSDISPALGVHTGPGLLAVCFYEP